jgi:hypothetical protein
MERSAPADGDALVLAVDDVSFEVLPVDAVTTGLAVG